MPNEHDFKKHYDPVIKHAMEGLGAANRAVFTSTVKKLATAVQDLLQMTHDEQAALGASPAVLAVITNGIAEYKKYEATIVP